MKKYLLFGLFIFFTQSGIVAQSETKTRGNNRSIPDLGHKLNNLMKKLLFTLLFLSSVSFVYSQYSISPNNSYVSSGGGTWGSILKMKASSINSGNGARFRIYKSDNGNFSETGTMYLRSGSQTGTTLVSKTIYAGNSYAYLDLDFTDYNSYPKRIYAYYKPTNIGGHAWVGYITIDEDQNSVPNQASILPFPSGTVVYVNQPINVNVRTGTDPDGDQTKVHLTAQSSNRTNSNPYISSWGNGNVTHGASITFTSTGSKTIYATTFDVNGNASGTVSKTINVQSPNSAPNQASILPFPSGTVVYVNQPINVNVRTGTDPDGDQTKVHLTAQSSNRTNSNPYISSWGNGNVTHGVSITFTSTGSKTIYATTFDVNGSASGTVSKTITVEEQSTTCNYTDSQPADWWHNAVQDLCTRNILDDDGACQPTEDLNRASLAKLTYLAIDLDRNPLANNYQNPFPDLVGNESVWYYPFVINLAYLEFTDNTSVFNRSMGDFNPSSGISRAHSLKVLFEAFDIDETSNSGNNPYSDVANNHDALDYIIKARDLGIIKLDASNPQFRPNENILRAEYFVLLHEVLTVQSIAIPDIADSDFYSPTTTCNFTDALPTDWWYDAVQDLCAREILDDDGECDPADDLNRAELAKLAYLSIGLGASTSYADSYPSPFIDLQSQTDAWYYSFAKNLAYLEFDDNTSPFKRDFINFRPSASISRAHTLKVLLETFNIDETNNSGNNPFNDVPSNHDAYDYIIKAKDLGIIDNDTSFSPNDNANRAETFVMLHRMLTVESLDIPTVTESDYYKPGNYTPLNFNNYAAMHSGNFSHYTKTSFGIPSIGIPLVFSHTYDSYLSDIPNKFTPIQPLGKLWNHSFNGYLQEINGDVERPNDFRVVFTLPNGGFQTYKKIGNNYVPETEGIYDELVKTSSTQFTLTTKGQIVYTFQKLSGTNAEFPFVLTTIKDRNNNTLTISYENAYKSGFKRIEEVTGTAGRKLQFNYHTQSDLIAKVADPLGRDVDFIYNSDGYLSKYTNPKNNHTFYNYGSGLQKEMLMTITLPKGNVITNTYDKKKLASTKTNGNTPTQYNYGAGYKTTFTDSEGKTTETTYNDLGNPKRIEQGSTTVTIGYDSTHKNLPNSVTYNGNTVQVSYDGKGNVLQRTLPLGIVQKYVYNAKNDLEKFTDAKGFEYDYFYNSAGNLNRVETPRGNTTFSVNSKGQITQVTNPENISVGFEYDSYGNRNKTTAPEGIVASSTFDVASRLKSVTNPNNFSIQYTLDDNDNLLSEVFNGQTTAYEVDKNDNVTKIINAKNNATTLGYNADDDTLETVNFGDATDEYSYYDNGAVKTYKNPKGITFTYVYDNQVRIKSVSGSGKTVSYSYDSQNNIETITNENGSITFGYDVLSRITKTTDYYGNIVKYEYDKNSNVTQITYPNNKVVSYTFYDDNLLASVTDWNSQTTTYTYRDDGLLSQTNYANGTFCQLSYDGAGRMISKTWKKSDNSVINGYSFELDKLGNHTKEIKTEPFGVIALNTETANYTHSATNQIVSDGTNSYAHDANGNNTANGNTTYGYDVYDRLISVTSTDFNASYKYDAAGNRRQRTANGITQRFVLDILGLSKVLLETDANNNVQNYYVYGLGLVSRIDNANNTHYYHDDFRGSIIALTDSNETITHKYQYTDFGSIAQIEEANYNPYRYVGKHGIQFEQNGLYFMRARYYDAHTGRFLTEDPVWATNLYPYAGNNPVMNVDPTGNISVEADALLTALVPAYGAYKAFKFTTQLGSEACKSYSYAYINSDSWVGKTGNAIGGGFSCLWTPETALETAFTLVTAGIGTGGKVVANKGLNVVYQGIDKAGVIRYVGITSRNAIVRFVEHLSSNTAKSLLRYEVIPGKTNLGRMGARILEQNLINKYGLKKNGGLLLNKINSIAPKDWYKFLIK